MTKFEFLLFFGLNPKILSVSQTCLNSASNLGSQEVASSLAKNCGCNHLRSSTPTYLKLRQVFTILKGPSNARPFHCSKQGIANDAYWKHFAPQEKQPARP